MKSQKNSEPKTELKKLKLKSESIFFDNQYDAGHDFTPALESDHFSEKEQGMTKKDEFSAQNLVQNNNFDYSIEGLKEKIKIQRHKTIDLKKVSFLERFPT